LHNLFGLQDEDGSNSQQFLVAELRNEQHITATSTAVVGLSNLGNTCFFNSSVQLLLACAPLQQMLLQHEHHIAKGPLGYALQQAAIFANGECANPLHPAS
jgi:ubiquitin C-terminal hydrolase